METDDPAVTCGQEYDEQVFEENSCSACRAFASLRIPPVLAEVHRVTHRKPDLLWVLTVVSGLESRTGPELREREIALECGALILTEGVLERLGQFGVPHRMDGASEPKSAGTVSGMATPSIMATRSATSWRISLIGTSSAWQMEASSSDEASF